MRNHTVTCCWAEKRPTVSGAMLFLMSRVGVTCGGIPLDDKEGMKEGYKDGWMGGQMGDVQYDVHETAPASCHISRHVRC